MSERNPVHAVLLVVMMFVLTYAQSAAAVPLTPEIAAKVETTRKQQEQRVTQDKKTAAAEALKAERLKIYNAKRATSQQSAPAASDNK